MSSQCVATDQPNDKICLVLERNNCEDLYPGKRESTEGCHGVQSCVFVPAVSGGMECNGWSVRVDTLSGRTEEEWTEKQDMLRAAGVDEGCWMGYIMHGLTCYVQFGCRRYCTFNFL